VDPHFPTGEPHSGGELALVLGRLLAEGTAALTALPLASFFAPQGAAWSPADHVRHLQLATTPLATALRLPHWILSLRFGRSDTGSRSFSRMRELYLDQLADGATAGRFTPRPDPPPADPAERRIELLRRWSQATVELTGALAPWSETALDRYRLPHPLLGVLTVREMLCFTVYHTSHHLRRIAERAAVA